MYRCESWTIKRAECQRIDAFEPWCWRRLLSPLDSKEIKPLNPKGNQPWIFIGRTDDEAEAPILWPPAVKSQLIGKDPDVGKDWRQKEKRAAEDEIDGWHRWLSELAQTHAHRVSDAIQPSHPLSSPSPPTFNLSQHQGLFQWVRVFSFFASGGQSIGVSSSASVLPMTIQD